MTEADHYLGMTVSTLIELLMCIRSLIDLNPVAEDCVWFGVPIFLDTHPSE